MGSTVFVLLDFDNFFKKEINQYTIQEFEYLIKEIINDVLSKNQKPNEIRIRLYGGWYKEDIFSTKASVLEQLLSNISIFPIIKGDNIIKGSIELATSIYYLPEHIWTHTLKEKEGISRLRISSENIPEWCSEHKDECPVFMLNKFTKSKEKKCHHYHCEVMNSNVFTGIEQKMVDTMIACDLVTFSQDEKVLSICLFTDDFDLLPPLALSSALKIGKNPSAGLQLFLTNERMIHLCTEILKPFDIKIFHHE